jgi:hypothetical protein
MSVSDPKRTSAFHSLGWLPVTILPFRSLLASLADSLQARLTAHSQGALRCGRYQRTTQVSTSLALSEASEALAGREGQMKAKRCFFGVCHLPNLLDMRVGLCQKRKQLVLR